MGIADELRHLFSVLFSVWVLIMSGVVAVIITIWEKKKERTLGWMTFRHILIGSLIVAAFYTWHVEYQERQALQAVLQPAIVASRGPSFVVCEHEGTLNDESGTFIIVSDVELLNRSSKPVVLTPRIRLLGRAGPLQEDSENDPLPDGAEEWLKSRRIAPGTPRLGHQISIDANKNEIGYVVFFIRNTAALLSPDFQTTGDAWLDFVDLFTGTPYKMALGTPITTIPQQKSAKNSPQRSKAQRRPATQEPHRESGTSSAVRETRQKLRDLESKSDSVLDACRPGATIQCVEARGKWEREIEVILKAHAGDRSGFANWITFIAQNQSGMYYNDVANEKKTLSTIIAQLR
jgi:hypothetical protein